MAELNIELPEFLHWQDGEVRLVGHRISLYHVVRQLRAGRSIEDVCVEFPTLTSDEVSAVLKFYDANRSVVDDYIDAYSAELDALYAANPQQITTEVLKARLAAKKREAAEVRKPSRTGTDG